MPIALVNLVHDSLPAAVLGKPLAALTPHEMMLYSFCWAWVASCIVFCACFNQGACQAFATRLVAAADAGYVKH